MSQPMKVKVKCVQIHLYIATLSVMSSCYSDFRYLDWFWSHGRKTEPLWRNFPCFGFFVYPPAPQTKIQNSVSIESGSSRFLRFRENLVELGFVDSEKLGWKNKTSQNISRRPTTRQNKWLQSNLGFKATRWSGHLMMMIVCVYTYTSYKVKEILNR